MTLSIIQQAIKKYIDKAHEKGYNPKISEVAKAFKITPDAVRGHLKAIKKTKNDMPDFFKDIFKVFKK